MATFIEFDIFSEDMANKIHDLNSDTFRWSLTNDAPNVASWVTKTSVTNEIAGGNGYTTGGMTAAMGFTRSGQTTTVTQAVMTLSATGAIPTFRYAVLWNDTPTSPADPLIGYIDHGSSITLANGDTYTIPAGSRFTIN